MKRVLVIAPGGKEVVLPAVPSSEQIRRIVGGDIEVVRVRDPSQPDASCDFTMMIVNETGLNDDLPRNERATQIYQRNARLAFPDADNPFSAAHDAWRKQYPASAVVTDLTPLHALDRGYKDDPWIAGTVIVFEGYTVESADEAIAAANKRKKQ